MPKEEDCFKDYLNGVLISKYSELKKGRRTIYHLGSKETYFGFGARRVTTIQN